MLDAEFEVLGLGFFNVRFVGFRLSICYVKGLGFWFQVSGV